jgi:hypothetical protein
MNKGRVGEERGGKETDRCSLTQRSSNMMRRLEYHIIALSFLSISLLL